MSIVDRWGVVRIKFASPGIVHTTFENFLTECHQPHFPAESTDCQDGILTARSHAGFQLYVELS